MESGLTLVLGEPGAGKTSLLAHWHAEWLAGLLLARLGLPVPVLLPLRSVEAGLLVGRPEEVADRLWDLRGARDRERTAAGECYHLPPRLLSPIWLLDGLDEFAVKNLAAPERRETFASLPGALVLSCRTAVFQQIRLDAEGAARRIVSAARELRITGLKPDEQENFLRLALEAEHLDPARAPELRPPAERQRGAAAAGGEPTAAASGGGHIRRCGHAGKPRHLLRRGDAQALAADVNRGTREARPDDGARSGARVPGGGNGPG